jgi:hypothetical protein
MIICRETGKLCLTNVRRFSQQTMEAHFDIQITAKEVSRIFYLNSDMSVATQKIMYGRLDICAKFVKFVFRGVLRERHFL